jgi:hypothetical protein
MTAAKHRVVGMLDVEALGGAVTLASMAMHLRLYSWAAAVPRGLAMVKGVLVVDLLKMDKVLMVIKDMLEQMLQVLMVELVVGLKEEILVQEVEVVLDITEEVLEHKTIMIFNQQEVVEVVQI